MKFIIDALATYRLTRLATEDTITDPHSPLRPNPAYILTCPHCASIYAAALTLILPDSVKKILALAAVTTLIHEYTDKSASGHTTATGWE